LGGDVLKKIEPKVAIIGVWQQKETKVFNYQSTTISKKGTTSST